MKKFIYFVMLFVFMLPIMCVGNFSAESAKAETLGTTTSQDISIADNVYFNYNLQFGSRANENEFLTFNTEGEVYKPIGESTPITMYSVKLREASKIRVVINQENPLASLTGAGLKLTYYKDWTVTKNNDNELQYSFSEHNNIKEDDISFNVFQGGYIANPSISSQTKDYLLSTGENDFNAGIYKIEYYFTTNINNKLENHTCTYYVYIIPDSIKANIEDYTVDVSAYISGTSKSGAFYAYNVEIVGDDFKYVDPKAITWHVKGQAKNGDYFVYSDKDLRDLSDEEKTYYKSLQQAPEQNMLVFTFNPQYEGKWNIYATFETEIEQPDGSFVSRTVSTNIVQIDTVKRLTNVSIILIASISMAIIVVLLIIGVYTQIRREKVY